MCLTSIELTYLFALIFKNKQNTSTSGPAGPKIRIKNAILSHVQAKIGPIWPVRFTFSNKKGSLEPIVHNFTFHIQICRKAFICSIFVHFCAFQALIEHYLALLV